MPWSSSAWVKTPVPPPSSITRRAPRGSSDIIWRASCGLEGEMAAMPSGFFSHWRKKVQPCVVVCVVACHGHSIMPPALFRAG